VTAQLFPSVAHSVSLCHFTVLYLSTRLP